jgi:hypothetical protein
MNRILALTVCFGLVLAQVAHAADANKNKQKKKHPNQTNSAQQGAQHGGQHNAKQAANQQAAQQASKQNLTGQKTVTSNTNRQFQKTTTVKGKNQNVVVKKNQVVVKNRNSYAVARSWNWHVHHDHAWWRTHYRTFVLFGGGYYFWNGGYWYPAYGYDPVYSTYAYDEPIYGYGGLSPYQVIVNVQSELRREGYYAGAIDGSLGPITRDALARYQVDQGLIVTRAIDEPTLESLGLA